MLKIITLSTCILFSLNASFAGNFPGGSSNVDTDPKELEFNEQLHFASHENNPPKEAQYNVGKYYAEGFGTTVNYEKAYYWLNKATKQGHIPARFTQSICCLIKPISDINKAVKGFTKAKLEAGKALKKSEKSDEMGTPEDIRATEKILNDVIAQAEVYLLLCELLNETKKEEEYYEAVSSINYLKPTVQSCPLATFCLAQCFLHGVGIKQNSGVAKELSRKLKINVFNAKVITSCFEYYKKNNSNLEEN